MTRPAAIRGEKDFRWQGGDVSRLESFTDIVFAFAVTLIVVSLEVPSTLDELFGVLKAFPAFAACFALLYWMWLTHFIFHRRYGLEDPWTRFLNMLLVFLVLFYIYPMKFLVGLVVQNFGPEPATPFSSLGESSVRALMVLYSGGFLAIWAVLALHFRHALRHARDLGLTPLEELSTRISLEQCLIAVGVSVLSLGLLFGPTPYWMAAAGWIYFLLGPLYGIHAWRESGRKEALGNAESGEGPAPA